ncbi:HDOD domain-containing protein [Motiliproteus coralliicola]|uniref:HDOD domain-containing protein n=1 Tax=Motiliproteus coralliicola TaxID=2283196 RepID=UPI0014040B51|nr:HDOD domain-containing protein [Motiliproteus coralliicola]
MSTPIPSGADQWLELLADKLLPVPARTVLILRKQLQNPAVSLQQLTPLIESDPVLSLHCVSLANQLNRNPDTNVTSIELAVATLGLERITELATKLPAIKLNNASVPHKQYYHALGNSFHAAAQARMLCRYRDASIINATRTAALFYGLGHWALWRYAPHQASEIKIRIYEQQQDSAEAEQVVLGCTVQQLSERLVEHWQLSPLAIEALKHENSPDAQQLDLIHQRAAQLGELDEDDKRTIKQLLNAQHYPVKLANWLCLTAPMGWNYPKTVRICQLISDLLQKPLDDTNALLHQQCVQASRAHPMPDLLNPAAMMLLLPSEQVLSYRLDSESAATKVETTLLKRKSIQPKVDDDDATPSSAPRPEPEQLEISDFVDKELFQRILHRLVKAVDKIKDHSQAIELVQKALTEALGAERALTFHIDGEMRLKTLSFRGCSHDDRITRLTMNLKHPGLLQRLAQKPTAVWVSEHNNRQIRAEMSERFRAVCHPDSFMLVSLFLNQRPSLIVYADMRDRGARLSQFQFEKFKQLMAAANRCMHQINQRDDG